MVSHHPTMHTDLFSQGAGVRYTGDEWQNRILQLQI